MSNDNFIAWDTDPAEGAGGFSGNAPMAFLCGGIKVSCQTTYLGYVSTRYYTPSIRTVGGSMAGVGLDAAGTDASDFAYVSHDTARPLTLGAASTAPEFNLRAGHSSAFMSVGPQAEDHRLANPFLFEPPAHKDQQNSYQLTNSGQNFPFIEVVPTGADATVDISIIGHYAVVPGNISIATTCAHVESCYNVEWASVLPPFGIQIAGTGSNYAAVSKERVINTLKHPLDSLGRAVALIPHPDSSKQHASTVSGPGGAVVARTQQQEGDSESFGSKVLNFMAGARDFAESAANTIATFGNAATSVKQTKDNLQNVFGSSKTSGIAKSGNSSTFITEIEDGVEAIGSRAIPVIEEFGEAALAIA